MFQVYRCYGSFLLPPCDIRTAEKSSVLIITFSFARNACRGAVLSSILSTRELVSHNRIYTIHIFYFLTRLRRLSNTSWVQLFQVSSYERKNSLRIQSLRTPAHGYLNNYFCNFCFVEGFKQSISASFSLISFIKTPMYTFY